MPADMKRGEFFCQRVLHAGDGPVAADGYLIVGVPSARRAAEEAAACIDDEDSDLCGDEGIGLRNGGRHHVVVTGPGGAPPVRYLVGCRVAASYDAAPFKE